MMRGFQDVQSQTKELAAKLGDEEEIFSVFKSLKVMNSMRSSFLAKIEGSSAPATKLQQIREHFREAKELERLFHEQAILARLQDAHVLAKKNPSLLVKVLRVVENEEVTSASLRQKL